MIGLFVIVVVVVAYWLGYGDGKLSAEENRIFESWDILIRGKRR